MKKAENSKDIKDLVPSDSENSTNKSITKYIKIFIIVLIVIIFIALICTIGRKGIIIASLNNKVGNYSDSTNFYVKSFYYSGNDLIATENYKKDDRYIKRITLSSEERKSVTTEYYNGEVVNTYNEFAEGEIDIKTARLNTLGFLAEPSVPNYLEITSPIQFIRTATFSSISSEECDGKDCYKIILRDSSKDIRDTVYYIDKENGLTVKSIKVSANGQQDDIVTNFEYMFDTLTEKDFVEPDVNEYKIEGK